MLKHILQSRLQTYELERTELHYGKVVAEVVKFWDLSTFNS
jgi:hypothetical protein